VTLEPLQIVTIALLGLLAGTFGGLAGVGASMIMIPGMALILGFSDNSHSEIHLYMAAAMGVNVFLPIPAAIRHARAGKVRIDLLKVLLPAMLATVVVGVVFSNSIPGGRLRILLATFILAYCAFNIARLFAKDGDFDPESERASPARLITAGGITGLISGLLGLGGGVIIIPLLQVLARVRLRQAIATALALMPIPALIGATLKVSTLPEHNLHVADALKLTLIIAPLAMLGAHLGASLSHRLPIKGVRVIILFLLTAIALKLLGAY